MGVGRPAFDCDFTPGRPGQMRIRRVALAAFLLVAVIVAYLLFAAPLYAQPLRDVIPVPAIVQPTTIVGYSDPWIVASEPWRGLVLANARTGEVRIAPKRCMDGGRYARLGDCFTCASNVSILRGSDNLIYVLFAKSFCNWYEASCLYAYQQSPAGTPLDCPVAPDWTVHDWSAYWIDDAASPPVTVPWDTSVGGATYTIGQTVPYTPTSRFAFYRSGAPPPPPGTPLPTRTPAPVIPTPVVTPVQVPTQTPCVSPAFGIVGQFRRCYDCEGVLTNGVPAGPFGTPCVAPSVPTATPTPQTPTPTVTATSVPTSVPTATPVPVVPTATPTVMPTEVPTEIPTVTIPSPTPVVTPVIPSEDEKVEGKIPWMVAGIVGLILALAIFFTKKKD